MGRSPATPPGMRVRTGRFEQLRSRQARHVQSVEIAESQHCFSVACHYCVTTSLISTGTSLLQPSQASFPHRLVDNGIRPHPRTGTLTRESNQTINNFHETPNSPWTRHVITNSILIGLTALFPIWSRNWRMHPQTLPICKICEKKSKRSRRCSSHPRPDMDGSKTDCIPSRRRCAT